MHDRDSIIEPPDLGAQRTDSVNQVNQGTQQPARRSPDHPRSGASIRLLRGRRAGRSGSKPPMHRPPAGVSPTATRFCRSYGISSAEARIQ
jgi:hypothetical protein